MFYIAKTPKWVRKLFTGSIWEMPQTEKAIYLTFDDGPHPSITPFVLDELDKFNAKASFFCIGKNVNVNLAIYKRILEEGHAVGNHTNDHLDGWKTGTADYLANVSEARNYINSNLFRPPYGRITRSQHIELTKLEPPFKIIMWSVLSGDFDVSFTAEQCCKNVLKHAKSGSVVVFHDSEKANERVRYTLPVLLKYFSEKGYSFKKLEFNA
jgi:peptidoglycan/xylan/chitin deacetylase (PgdA/CDA1 family)